MRRMTGIVLLGLGGHLSVKPSIMTARTVMLTLTSLLLFTCCGFSPAHSVKVTNIGLIGATGDLAKKYLWQGLFNLYQKEQTLDHEFRIFGGARVETSKGQKLLQEILDQKIACDGSRPSCDAAKEAFNFKGLVAYYQLKNENDYIKFCSMVNTSSHSVCSKSDDDQDVCYHDSSVQEAGRLFYFSIPSYAYAETARFISKYCRPVSPESWLRVVLEKPFGSDLYSAEKLAKDLSLSLKEEEMYRIDHYLGKTISLEILKFRKANKDTLGHMWDSNGIDRVDIVMSETVDAQGRTLFYDEYGVIRDVMQNHLTELLVLVAMEVPNDLTNVTEVHQKKLELLKDVNVISPENVVIGQYEDYISHVQEDYEDKEKRSRKPTFAAALLQVSNNRWHGVNFHLVSGKKLKQRASYIKVTFKNQHMCLVKSDSCTPEGGVLLFNIGHGDVGMPAIAMTKSLPKPNLSWSSQIVESKLIFGRKADEYSIFVPPTVSDAYSSLILGVFHGNRDLFVSTEGLMVSWEKWTPAVQYLDRINPKTYKGGEEINGLNFRTNGTRLQFLPGGKPKESPNHVFKNKFRGAPLNLGDTFPLIEKLARDVLKCAQDAIAVRGVFHIAVPGGTSAPKFFQGLLNLRHEFPWQHTHIWTVDERCVPFSDKRSNFGMIQANLLKFIRLPFTNIHPMPIELANGVCNEADRGDRIYEASIHRLVRNTQFDFVVLGVGEDGHTASLFPGAKSLQEMEKSVIYSDGGPSENSAARMTLTYPIINKSRNIAVIIFGKGKASLVKPLNSEKDIQAYPITGVVPEDGTLTWYIDSDAFFLH